MPKSNVSISDGDDLKMIFTKELKEINKKLDIILKHINSDDKSVSKEIIKKAGSITINKFPNKLEISGQTFEVKDLLKQNKAVWDKSKKSWYINYDDNSWFNKFKKNLEQQCNNIKIINKSENIVNQDIKSNSSDDLENQVFEFLEDD